ncbi:MAG: MATE family efflux transporter [Porcipelethomonas sp.]
MTNDNLIRKKFNSFLGVSVLATLAATIGMLVDGIVIGQYLGRDCVSSFGLASPVFILIAALAGIFSNGGTSCCSRYIGRGEEQGIKLNFSVTCAASVITGILVTLICILCCTPIAELLGAEGDLIFHTSEYIRGIGMGGIVIILSQVIMIYIRMDDDSMLGFISVLFMTACNIALDIIFGIILKLGMYGMGLATSISYLVCLLVCMLHFRKKKNKLKLTGLKNGMKEFVDVFLTGVPSALNRACMTIRAIFLNYLLITLGGSIAVSALAVQNNVNQLLSSVTMGVGMTVMLMAGIFYGGKDEAALGSTLRVSLKTGMFLSALLSVIVFIFARPIVGMFLSSDVQAMELAVRSLRMFVLSLPLSLACVALINFYQCTENLFMANFICICHGLVFVVLYSLILSPAFGTDGIWISFLLSEMTTIICVLVVVGIRNRKMPRSLDDIMMIPQDFEPDKDRMLNISLKNDIQQVMQLSSQVEGFCRKYSSDDGKITKLSLFIEEIVGNIVQHAYKDEKEHSIDIKIIMEKEDIILCIRDDGVAFNPLLFEPDDNKLQIGISMVRKMAKDINYKNLIGMNNLTIVL